MNIVHQKVMKNILRMSEIQSRNTKAKWNRKVEKRKIEHIIFFFIS